MISTVGQLSQWLEALGNIEQALTEAERHTALDPLDEGAHRQVMRLLRRQGQRLRRPGTLRRLPADPGRRVGRCLPSRKPPPSTSRFFSSQKRQTPNCRPAEPACTSDSHGGPGARAGATASEAVRPACRLVTVIGPGGTGKTCLALEAGRSMKSFFGRGISGRSGYAAIQPVASGGGCSYGRPGFTDGA